jgi:hypothetical protein
MPGVLAVIAHPDTRFFEEVNIGIFAQGTYNSGIFPFLVVYLFHGAPGLGEIPSLVAIILLKYINVKSCHNHNFSYCQKEKGTGTVIKKKQSLCYFFRVYSMSQTPDHDSGATSCDNYIQRFIRNYMLWHN